jgi:hypothetical protein
MSTLLLQFQRESIKMKGFKNSFSANNGLSIKWGKKKRYTGKYQKRSILDDYKKPQVIIRSTEYDPGGGG